jgi:hypothetical protein
MAIHTHTLVLIAVLLCGQVLESACKVGGEHIWGHSVQVDKAADVDEQLYSRQLFVYGVSAQKRLLDARILLRGQGPVLAEIVKNLALAGVGSISISSRLESNSSPSIKGPARSLAAYARSLNPQIQVRQCIDSLRKFCPYIIVRKLVLNMLSFPLAGS